MNAQDVQELFDGLEKNELIGEYTHVLTGTFQSYTTQRHLPKISLIRLHWQFRNLGDHSKYGQEAQGCQS